MSLSTRKEVECSSSYTLSQEGGRWDLLPTPFLNPWVAQDLKVSQKNCKACIIKYWFYAQAISNPTYQNFMRPWIGWGEMMMKKTWNIFLISK
jgi:hypothetical protein